MHEEVTTPELTEAVARLSALLGPRHGGVELLEGGITNRNYRVNFGGTDYVVRMPGKDTALLGIDREAERLATKRAGELGIGPRVATMLDRPPSLVTFYVRGRPATPEELREPARVDRVAQSLRAFHRSGLELPSSFEPLATAERYAKSARARGASFPAGYRAALSRARAAAESVAARAERAPSHNDLLTANLLLRDGRDLVIIGWEYAGMGDPLFDLGNFAVHNELSDEQEERLLTAYFGERPTARVAAAVKLTRLLSDFREAMWGLLQQAASELEFDFAGYSRRHFERFVAAAADPRFASWLEQARR